jgi:hypothetical protein
VSDAGDIYYDDDRIVLENVAIPIVATDVVATLTIHDILCASISSGILSGVVFLTLSAETDNVSIRVHVEVLVEELTDFAVVLELVCGNAPESSRTFMLPVNNERQGRLTRGYISVGPSGLPGEAVMTVGFGVPWVTNITQIPRRFEEPQLLRERAASQGWVRGILDPQSSLLASRAIRRVCERVKDVVAESAVG